MTLPAIISHIDWSNDWQWVGYEILGPPTAPPPHTWQDWVVAGLMFVALAVMFLAIACFAYLWRKGYLSFLDQAFGDD